MSDYKIGSLLPSAAVPVGLFLATTVMLPHTFAVQASAAVIAAAALGLGVYVSKKADKNEQTENLNTIKNFGTPEQQSQAKQLEQKWQTNRAKRAPWVASALAIAAIPGFVLSGVLVAPIGLCVAGAIAYAMVNKDDKKQIKEERAEVQQIQSLANAILERRTQSAVSTTAPTASVPKL